MLKAIFAKHVKVGDCLLLSGGKSVEVRYVGRHSGGIVDLVSRDRATNVECSILLREYDIVGLGHRPRQMADARARDAVRACALRVAQLLDRYGENPIHSSLIDPDKIITELAEAVVAYELGKPLPTPVAKGGPSEGKLYEDAYDSNGNNRCLGSDD